MALSLPDTVARNARLWKQAVRYCAENTIETGRIILTALASSLPSFLEPSYLISAELYAIKKLGLHGLNNQFPIGTMVLSPFLYADAFAGNYEMLWDMWDDFKEWKETSTSFLATCLFRKTLHKNFSSPEEGYRREFGEKLEKLNKALFSLPEKQAAEMYDDVLNLQQTIANTFKNLDEDEVKAYQAMLTLRYFLALSEDIEKGAKPIPSIYELATDGLNYASLLTGSFMRLFTLQYIMEGLLSLIFSTRASNIGGWVLGAVAFPFQTLLEYQGTRDFCREFLWHEDPHAHSSHPGGRLGAKIYVSAWGLFNTIPLVLLNLQMINSVSWMNNPYYLLLAIPYFLPEFFAQTVYFNETYNQELGSGIASIHNKGTRKKRNLQPRPDWKRDKLIEMVQAGREDMKGMNPVLIQKLKESLLGDK